MVNEEEMVPSPHQTNIKITYESMQADMNNKNVITPNINTSIGTQYVWVQGLPNEIEQFVYVLWALMY